MSNETPGRTSVSDDDKDARDNEPITSYNGLNFEIFPAWAPALDSNSILPAFQMTVADDFHNRAGVFRATLEDLLFVTKDCTAGIISTLKVARRLETQKLVTFLYSKEEFVDQLDRLIQRLEECKSIVSGTDLIEKYKQKPPSGN